MKRKELRGNLTKKSVELETRESPQVTPVNPVMVDVTQGEQSTRPGTASVNAADYFAGATADTGGLPTLDFSGNSEGEETLSAFHTFCVIEYNGISQDAIGTMPGLYVEDQCKSNMRWDFNWEFQAISGVNP